MKNLIIGGTGTLGHALVEKLGPESCIVFSRDELKQQNMRKKFNGLKTVLGDVRDQQSLVNAMMGVQRVFHVAALKHVDILEEYPEEAFHTNVNGVVNAANAAKICGVKNFVFTSTDKAVLPINVYGMTKAMAEKYLLQQNKEQSETAFNVYRWGNIIGSRGSAIHFFAKTLREQKTAYITNVNMTRFWMLIEDAVEFMLSYQDPHKVCFPQMKAAPVIDVVRAVANILKIDEYKTVITGIRPGEKLHESLHYDFDFNIKSDTAPRHSVASLEKMIRPLLEI